MKVKTNVKAGDVDGSLGYAPPSPGSGHCWDQLNSFMNCCKGDSNCLR